MNYRAGVSGWPGKQSVLAGRAAAASLLQSTDDPRRMLSHDHEMKSGNSGAKAKIHGGACDQNCRRHSRTGAAQNDAHYILDIEDKERSDEKSAQRSPHREVKRYLSEQFPFAHAKFTED
jgi:hypothetical protein